jgi:hypothetical protein
MASKFNNADEDCRKNFRPCISDWEASKTAGVVSDEDSCSHRVKPAVEMVEAVEIKFPCVKPSKTSFEENYALRKEDIEYRNKMEAKRLRKEDPYAKVVKTVPFGFI